MNESVSVCNICKDPVWSFICPDCLGADIKAWLPAELAPSFESFHSGLIHSFYNKMDVKFEYCVKCRALRDGSICPFCYMAEAYNWLRDTSQELAYRVYKFLPLAKDWKVTECDGCVWKSGFSPMGEREARSTHPGICDGCEEYSDSLVLAEGQWVCTECLNDEL